MSNKPKIYANCKAGCSWETVHRDEFLASASHIEQFIDNGVCYLQNDKEYKIFADKNTDNNFNCSLLFSYSENGVVKDYVITNINNDKYAKSFVFRFLEQDTDGSTITIVYELAGIRYTETINGTELALLAENFIRVTNATKVLLYNADAQIVAKEAEGSNTGGGSESTPQLFTHKYIVHADTPMQGEVDIEVTFDAPFDTPETDVIKLLIYNFNDPAVKNYIANCMFYNRKMRVLSVRHMEGLETNIFYFDDSSWDINSVDVITSHPVTGEPTCFAAITSAEII